MVNFLVRLEMSIFMALKTILISHDNNFKNDRKVTLNRTLPYLAMLHCNKHNFLSFALTQTQKELQI